MHMPQVSHMTPLRHNYSIYTNLKNYLDGVVGLSCGRLGQSMQTWISIYINL